MLNERRIEFHTWTITGLQGDFGIENKEDKTKKKFELDSVTLGVKSYAKFSGFFLPECPFYIELALAEKETENYDDGIATENDGLIHIFRDHTKNSDVSWLDGLKNLGNGIADSLSHYSSNSQKSPYMGHLKFGFNTPYLNLITGFNNSKLTPRKAITWATIGSDWDAGYEKIGGFVQFSGGKSFQNLFANRGIKLDAGFIPNRSADRKGSKYGYIGWLGFETDNVIVDLQSNGMFGSDNIFYDPVEHDFIAGIKSNLYLPDDETISIAAQSLYAMHQKSSDDIINDLKKAGEANPHIIDYFGYSTDVFYRDTDFGLQKFAGNANVTYITKNVDIGLEYKFRGAQASMLYVNEGDKNDKKGISSQLGVLNSQNASIRWGVKVNDIVTLNIREGVQFPLETISKDDTIYKKYWEDSAIGRPAYYKVGNEPMFGVKGGAEFFAHHELNVALNNINLCIYSGLKFNGLEYEADLKHGAVSNKYSASDSTFLFEKAGVMAEFNIDKEILKKLNVFYGVDNRNANRLFNTLVGEFSLAKGMKVDVSLGLKTFKNTDAKEKTIKDEAVNNMFAGALGFSKQFENAGKPILYAQFLYNMDPFRHFGDGHDNLNLDKANVNGSFEKNGRGEIDPVDWFDGRAALRMGIRWNF